MAALVLTLCIFGQCNETTPELFNTMQECTQALQDIDSRYTSSLDLFSCKVIEEN